MRVRQHSPRRLVSRAAVLPLVAFAALTTFACNLDKLTQPVVAVQVQLKAAVTGDTTVAMGATLPLSITTAKGALDNTAAVAWTSDKPTIATVNATTGLVTGVGIGSATISAKVIGADFGEVTATALKVRVKYAGISIKAVDSLIAIGMVKAIDVRGTDPAGTALASIPFGAAMTVVSRDTTIFTIDATGSLVARKNGSARVFVQYDGAKDSTIVKVRQVTRALTYAGTVAGELPVGSLNKDRTIAITAADSLGVAIAAPTVTWATSDATTLTVVAATGVARALKIGTATITATSDGFAKPILARITQVPATLTKTAATDGLSAVVNKAVALPPEVTVVDSGNTPIPAIAVTFAVASGGGTITGGTQTSATTGKAAATSWVLGTTVGANTVVASAGGASATFTATGTFGDPKKLGFLTQPSNAAIGAVITPAIRVAVLDSLNNVVTTATSSITIALGSGTGTLSGGTGTLTVAAVAGIATFSTVSINTAGAFTIVASTTGLTSATSNSFGIFGAVAKLGFTTNPIGGTAGQLLQSIRVAVQDAGGNTVTTDTRTITIALTAGTGATGAVLGGTLTVAAVAGVATFSNITVDRAGTGYTLSAASNPVLTAATSTTFDIVAVGPPAKLGFTVQPTSVVSGASITPSIQVAVQDVGGVTNTGSTAAITLAIETNPGGSTLSGTVTVNAIAGVATFAGISLNRVATGYKLNATSGSLTKAVSNAFNVTAGAATKVGYLVPPANAVAGATIAPQVQVAIQDANSNTVTTSTANVTLAVGAGPTGAALGGTVTVAAVAGVASFANLTLTPASTGYTLTASSPSITSATSPAFTITANATTAIKLGYLTQPTNVASNTNITPSIQVVVQDANGATVTSSSASITLALGSNAAGATASGTLTVGASSGVATFTNVQVGLAGTAYTLVATAPAAGLTSATSTPFNVTFGTAAKLGFVVQPTTVVAGTPFTADLQVAVLDAAGNVVTSATNVITLGFNSNPGGSQLRGTTSVAAVSGIATFPGVRLTKTGTGYTLFASSTGLNGSTSLSFDVTPAPAVALAFKTQPVNVLAGALQPSPFIQVAVVDSLGNVITTATDQISLAANTIPTNGAMIGTTPVAAISGVATFSDVKFNVSGSYTLAATATNLATVTSNGFFISAGPAAALKWVANPAVTGLIKNGPIRGNSSIRLEVDIVDAQGNTIFSDNTTSVTIGIGTPGAGPGGGTLSGTVTLGAAFGQVFFSDLAINSSGTGYTLTASSGALTAATSTAFDLAAFGSPSQWKFTQPPTNTTAGTAFSPVVKADLKDQFGNTITAGTNSTLTANIGIANSPPPGVGITGSTSAVASAGVATFTGLAITGAADGLNLFVYGTTVGGESSAAFNSALVIPTTTAYDVAIDGTNAYYLERGTVASSGTLTLVNLSTGAKTTLASSLNFPAAVVVDNSNVYWIEDGNGAANSSFVKRVPIGGGTPTIMSIAMTNAAPILKTDSSFLYFITNNAAVTPQREIRKLANNALAGTTPTTLFTGACGTTCTPAFTLSSGTIYFFDGTSAIRSMTTAGLSQTTLVATLTGTPISIAFGASTLYWGTSTTIFSAPAAVSATATSRATHGSTFTRLAFDGSSVYSLDGTSIRKYSTSDFSFTALTTTTAGTASRAMVFDTYGVYWADNGVPSRIRRIAK